MSFMDKIEKIAFLVNYNLYESKRQFVKQFMQALQKKDIEVEVYDTSSLTHDLAIELQLFSPDFVCSFNSTPPLPDGRFFWDILKLPYLSCLVDPAFYSLNLLKSPYSIISCVDRYDCEIIKSQNFENVFFLPHAVEKNSEVKKIDRPFDIVLLGSCYDYESLKEHWKKELSSDYQDILEDAISLVLSDKHIPLLHALTAAWKNAKLPLHQEKFSRLFYLLDNYTRGLDRVELIKAIKNRPIHIFGEQMMTDPVFKKGWDYYLKGQKNVILHPSVPYTEIPHLLQQSKICLNSMPFFKNGSHERIFLSFANGTLPLTTENLYIEEQFQRGKEILFYTPGQWRYVNELLENLLNNESQRKEMTEKGYQKVISSHTWDNRVDALLKEIPPILQKL